MLELAQNKFTPGLKTAIQKNRAQHCFKRVSQGGGAVASAGIVFALAQSQLRADADLTAMRGESGGVHQFGPGFGERAFIGLRKFFKKLARKNQAQHGIAKKFQPLIMGQGDILLVRNGRMRQRQAQQGIVAEPVTKAFLKCDVLGHGNQLAVVDSAGCSGSSVSAGASTAARVVGNGGPFKSMFDWLAPGHVLLHLFQLIKV